MKSRVVGFGLPLSAHHAVASGLQAGEGGQLRVGERLVEGLPREVVVQHLGEENERVERMGQLLDVRRLSSAIARVSPTMQYMAGAMRTSRIAPGRTNSSLISR